MNQVTVDLTAETPYAEPDSFLYRFRRRVTLLPVLRRLRPKMSDRADFALLEVGTGSGFLLEYLEGRYSKARLIGVEYDPRLVELTQRKLRRSEVLQGNAERLELGDRLFDVVVSLQVIEHLFKPEAMLRAIHRHLKPGGVLLITTPNLGCLSARAMKKKWHGFRADHVSLKSKTEWEAFIQAHGFKVLYSGSTFFSGIPLLNRLPLGVVNWAMLFAFGSFQWSLGESFVGVFERTSSESTK